MIVHFEIVALDEGKCKPRPLSPAGAPFSRLAVGASVDELEVLGRALSVPPGLQLVFDPLPLAERADAGALHGRDVDEGMWPKPK